MMPKYSRELYPGKMNYDVKSAGWRVLRIIINCWHPYCSNRKRNQGELDMITVRKNMIANSEKEIELRNAIEKLCTEIDKEHG